jgi:tetratricopeptide (TPR) repeat protein
LTYEFETAAWLLVHYLEDVRPQQFDAFMDLLAQGKRPRAAFDTAFPGLAGEKLSGELREYFKAGRLGTLSVPAPDWSGKIAVRKLPPAEIRALRAEIYLLPRIEHAVRREVANALSLDPGQPEAIAVRAKLGGGDAQEQIALARNATKLHPDDVRSWLVFLAALPKKADPERHDAVQAALRAAPEEPAALIAAAWDAIDSSQPAEAAKWAGSALRVAPWSIDALEALAAAQAADGRCREAADVIERAVNMLPTHKSFTKRRQRLRDRRARFASGGEECRGAVRPAVASDADRD